MMAGEQSNWPVISIPDNARELDADRREYLRELAATERAKRPPSFWDRFDIEAVGAVILMLSISLAGILALIVWAHG